MAVEIYSSTPAMPRVDGRHLQHVALPIGDSTQVSEARRSVSERTSALRFSERAAGEAAIVATEMAGNLAKHGGGGELLLRTLGEEGNAGIELLALDRGRGMDVARCLVDGYSTASSPGTGLGAIRRLSTTSDFYSVAGGGTAVLSTIWNKTAPACGGWLVGGVNVPLPGADVCGDAWVVRCYGRGIDVLIADGLGHGPEAARASMAAVGTFLGNGRHSPLQHFELADGALQATRGAAMGVAAIDFERAEVAYGGIGNTVAVVITGDSAQHLVSVGGIVGQHRIPSREYTAPWTQESMFIAHTDGIATRWSLTAYPGLAARHPSIIAGVLYRDFLRGRDDASVLVVKPGRAGG